MAIHVTADPHFDHERMRYMRAFTDKYTMTAHIVSIWNAHVAKTDEVYLLGDVSFAGITRTREILDALNGRIYLVRGNHDKNITRPALRDRFEWIKDYHVLKHEGQRYVMCHFPFETWDQCHRGAFHLHGHSHGNGPRMARRRDVGWDVYKRPMRIEELYNHMKNERRTPRDHHR